MKHKHAELIHAWADGAQIQYFCVNSVAWINMDAPNWFDFIEYRIKPTRPQWQQDLIDAVKSGKVVEFESGGIWFPCRINDDPNSYDFRSSPVTKYRIKPEEKQPVVRWLWAYKTASGWVATSSFYTDGEVEGSKHERVKLEYTRMEFSE